MKFLNSMTFQVSHDLYEPWEGGKNKTVFNFVNEHNKTAKRKSNHFRGWGIHQLVKEKDAEKTRKVLCELLIQRIW